jgi:hypothetical protein
MMDYRLGDERYRMALAKKATQRGPEIERMREAAKKLAGLRETAFLLGIPRNAPRLHSRILAQAQAGKLIEPPIVDEPAILDE